MNDHLAKLRAKPRPWVGLTADEIGSLKALLDYRPAPQYGSLLCGYVLHLRWVVLHMSTNNQDFHVLRSAEAFFNMVIFFAASVKAGCEVRMSFVYSVSPIVSAEDALYSRLPMPSQHVFCSSLSHQPGSRCFAGDGTLGNSMVTFAQIMSAMLSVHAQGRAYRLWQPSSVTSGAPVPSGAIRSSAALAAQAASAGQLNGPPVPPPVHPAGLEQVEFEAAVTELTAIRTRRSKQE